MPKQTCRFCNNEYSRKKLGKFEASTHLRSCVGLKKYIENILTKDFLYNEYIKNQKSAIEIANEHGLGSASLILRLLTEYDIKSRSISKSKNTNRVKEKTIKTCQTRYGTDHIFCKDSVIRKKMEKDLIKKYGVSNVFQIPEIAKRIQEKSLQTKIELGKIIHPDDLSDWQKYKRDVHIRTEKIYKCFKHIINFDNLTRGRNKFQLDHKISIKFGFENLIPAWIISHPMNLTMLSEHENISKGSNCSISLNELYDNIAEWESINE